MTRRKYGDETILTLTISSGTHDPKSQPFLYTTKSKRASATAGAFISKSHKNEATEAWKALRLRVLTYVTRGHRSCLGFVEPTIAIQG